LRYIVFDVNVTLHRHNLSSEYVKIDAKALSVGMYQHDVNQKALAEELARVVGGAVTSVGVDLNQARWW
jgi:uncharacterized protein